MSISVIDFNSRWSTLLFLVIIWLNLVLIGGMLMSTHELSTYQEMGGLLSEGRGQQLAGELSWRNGGRWRRQALFNEHVVVHSMDSNISISKQLMVLSSQSRIELRETHLNSTVWSDTSLLAFDGTSQESVALRTTNTTITELRLNTAHLQAVANGLELNTTTERDGSGQSRLNLALVGNVNVSMTDDSLANPIVLEAFQGTMVGGLAQTWENSNVTSTKLSIASVPDQTSNTRQLSVAVVSPTYQMQLRLEGAEVALLYGKFRLNIAADYRTLVLQSDQRLIQLHSISSPFEIMVTDSELTIDCFEEKTNVRVLANSPAINVKVGQFSRISTNLSETGGVLRVQNTGVSEDLAVESIDILSLASQLFIDEVVPRNNSSSVLIQALQSQLGLKTNASQAKLTSARQAIEILGGQPRIALQTGNVTIILSSSVNQSIPAPLFQPSQLAPSEEMDRAFANIGPYATQSPGQTTNNSQSFDSKAEIPVNQLPDVLTGASPSLPLPTPITFTINSTNFFHVTVDPNAMERVTTVDSAGGISSTTFPLPDPSLLHSNVQEDGEVIHVENGWTRTTKADNFVIGQYENGNNINEHGSTPTTTGSSESMATSDSTLFPIFATISAIDVQAVINDTGEEEGTIQDSAEQQAPGKLRRLRHLTVGSPPHNNQQSSNSKLLVELKVKVTQPINLSPEDLKLKLERHLNTVANSALNSPGIDNHPMTIVEVMDAHLASDFSNSTTYPTLIIHLMVQTGSMQDFPAIVEQLNQLDELVLDEELGNRIFSDMRVKRRSPAIYSILQSFAFIPAGILIISVSFAIVFWAVGAKSLFYNIFVRSIRSYRNRRRVQSIRSEVDSRVSQSP